ncbi:MAG: 4-hydroxy-tetrahydrodipicolinate synthase [Gammaproteobacteria bacterium]|nr:4-hydroxy-tetrahydrodipicolinate synthase [Gammaproteobacteria bacterium]
MFTGSIVALVTPMTATGSIDWDALARLIEWHVEEGTDGIVPVGTTGESATLDTGDHIRVIEEVVRMVAGRVPVIAGTGSNSTAEALELTRAAKDAGADAALQVTPYYNKPTQEGLFRHYALLAEEVDLPQVLYNVPGRTACDLLPATVARLAPLRNIVAIKEASGDVARVAEIHRLCGKEFAVLSGEDGKNLELMRAGACGLISVTANVVPGLLAAFTDAMLSGQDEAAAAIDVRLQPLHRALFLESNPIPVKWALYELGRIDAGIRLPLTPLSEQFREPLRQVLVQLGLLAERTQGETIA